MSCKLDGPINDEIKRLKIFYMFDHSNVKIFFKEASECNFVPLIIDRFFDDIQFDRDIWISHVIVICNGSYQILLNFQFPKLIRDCESESHLS